MGCMHRLRIGLLLWVLPACLAHAAAGRVLIAVGDVSAMRNGTTIKLERNSAVESGDVLRTGEASNLQLRFSDGSLFALRSNTQFSIDAFAFKPGPDATAPPAEEKGFFSLLRGGLRTISGLVGKKDLNAYAVRTANATIGIRGTNYNLVVCQGDCHNGDGSLAKDGTYGGVLQGAIVVSNQSGEQRIERDEFFQVAGANNPVQRLLSPPPFLRDRLDGQVRSNHGGAPADSLAQTGSSGQAAVGGETAGVGNASSTGGTQNNPLMPPVIASENLGTAGNSTVLSSQQSTNPSQVSTGDGVLPTALSAMAEISATSTQGGNHIVECDADSCSNPSTATTITRDAQGLFEGVSAGGYVSRGSATVAQSGADGGVIEWGRWTGGPISAGGWFNGLTFGPGQGFHYLVGLPTAALPTAGVVSYNLIGGTTPTFSDGVGGGLGTGILTGGTTVVNFSSQTLNANLNIQFTNGSYTLSTSNTTFSSAQFNGAASFTKTGGSVDVCGGGSCSATLSGFFAGVGASHLGFGYDISAGTGTTFYINGVAVYKR